MADTTKMQAEQAQTAQVPGTGTGTPASDLKSDGDELMATSQQLVRTLFRTGVHLAMTPVTMLPEEPRKHFVSAGREFSRGMASLAQELANVFDKMVNEVKEDGDV